MRKILAAIGLVVLLCGPRAVAVPTMAAHTAVVVFNARSMHVTARTSGYCWVTSIASQRRDAFRCMAGNAIHDPCFERSAREVACPEGASGRSGILLSLTKPLPPSGSGTRNVWKMQLASGATCNVGTGTITPGYPFYCSGNLVCSSPRAGAPAVFVRCAAMNG